MDISVLVPCLDAADTLGDQLQALVTQNCSLSYEILVSDNGSRDRSCEIARSYAVRHPECAIRIIDSSAVRGVCHARNRAIAEARSEFIAICDADDIVGPKWIQAMYEGLQRSPIVASVMSLERVNPAWVIRAFESNFGSKPQPYFGFLPAQAGWGLGIRKGFHYEIGEFDESFLRQGDIDYSWKAQLAGAEIFVAEDAIVYYRIKSQSSRKLIYAIRDGMSTYRLFERYAASGMPRPKVLDSLSGMKRSLRKLLSRMDPSERLKELHLFGRMLGFQWQKLRTTHTLKSASRSEA